MRIVNLVVSFVVAVFWIVSLTFILGPQSVQEGLFGGLGTIQIQALGLTVFLMSLLVITLWAVSIDSEGSEIASSGTSNPRKI